MTKRRLVHTTFLFLLPVIVAAFGITTAGAVALVLLTLLPIDELKDIRDKGPFPLEMCCHYCNTRYQFRRADVQGIYGRRYPNN